MARNLRLREKADTLAGRLKDLGKNAAGILDRLAERHGWVAVLEQALRDFFRHGMTLHAGNFAYSAFLAIFPLILLTASVVGFIFSYNPDVMQTLIRGMRELLPEMPTTINNAADSLVRLRGVVGVFGLIGLLWSVSKIAYAVQSGFEEVWETQKRSFVKKRVFSFGVMLLLLLVGLIGLGVTFVTSQFFSWLKRETGPVLSTLAVVLGTLLKPAATILILAVLYRTVPLTKPRWKEVLWGALVAALLLDAVEYGLGFYFTRISRTQALYGSLGIALGVVLWLYMVGILIFLGAEIVHALHARWGNGVGETGGTGGPRPRPLEDG